MEENLVGRTKSFSLNILDLYDSICRTDKGRILGRQLLRSSTSVGANYRAARRARSKAEFYAKLCIVVEEIDEVHYWLELLAGANILNMERLSATLSEADELLRIFSTMRKNARRTNKMVKH